MALVERERQPEQIRGVERSLEVKLGSLGGFELRPTRLFLWSGAKREGSERLVAFGERPGGLEYERHETSTRAGAVEMRTLGNPLMTIALAGAVAFKRWTDAQDEPEARRAAGEAGGLEREGTSAPQAPTHQDEPEARRAAGEAGGLEREGTSAPQERGASD